MNLRLVAISPDKANNIDIQTKSEIHKAENKSSGNSLPMEKFLQSCSAKGTMKSYRRGLELFIEFYKKQYLRREDLTDEQVTDIILQQRKDENLVDFKNRSDRFEKILEEFHAWMLKPIHTINDKPNQAYAINSARVNSLGIMQLFRYYNMGIVLRAGSPVSQTVVST